MIKKLFNKCIEWARHKYANPLLAFVSFIESSFFPIPPDVMIVPMVIAKKEAYVKILLIATNFSVLGGILGYFIGSFFLDLSMIVIEFYGYEEKVFELQNKLSTTGGIYLWLGTLFLAGFTPLPFKVFTITSGLINFNLIIFILICLVSRGLRFFIVSYFSMKFGEKFVNYLQNDGAKLFTIIGIAIVIIFAIIYFIIR